MNNFIVITWSSDIVPSNYYVIENLASCALFSSRQLLCQFHVLQAQWRWILQSQHGIAAVDRPQLFSFVKKLMYAQTQWELNTQ